MLWMERGLRPGVETPDQPVVLDVLDAGDVVGGVEDIGLASGSSSATGCW